MQNSLQSNTKAGASPADGHQVLLNMICAARDRNCNNPGNAGLFFLSMNAAHDLLGVLPLFYTQTAKGPHQLH